MRSRFHCSRSTAVIIALALASISPPARADSCETSPGSGIYTNEGCNKPRDYEVRQGGRKPAAAAPVKPAAGESLRDKLRRAMKERVAKSAEANRIAGRITDAQDRAKDALRRGNESADPDTRAKARLDFNKAMKDLTKAYADADALIPADKRADWQQMKQNAIADLQKQSEQAFGGSTVTTARTPSPAPNPDVFEHCENETTRYGVKTCYQAPRMGLSCTMVHKQGGEVIWSDHQQPCKNTRILEMRNEYFNRREVAGRSGNGTMQSAPAASLSVKCKSELNALLEGARKRDGGKAHAAYAALRADCDEAIRKLARDANARLPERRLSARASGALARAMSREALPEAGAGSSRDVGNPQAQEAYNVDEVIGLGLDLLALLNGVAAAQASRSAPSPAASPAAQPRPTYGQGAPTPAYRAPRAKPSDITGTK